MLTVKQAVFRIFREHGIHHVFGNPGSNEIPFLADMPDDMHYVLGLHEGAVVSTADGYAQATGRPTIVNLHSAAGTGNGMGAIANAQAANSPLVLIAGQQARAMIGLNPMLANQDATLLPRPLVKWSYEPQHPADVPRAISEAIHMAMTPPCGPVYLSIPFTDWSETVDEDVVRLLCQRRVHHCGQMAEGVLTDLQTQLIQAQRPLIIAGPEADSDMGFSHLQIMAERLQADVWLAPSAHHFSFANTHANFRGVLPASIKGICDVLEGHDLVLIAGAPAFRYHMFITGAFLPAQTRVIQLTANAADAARAPFGDAYVCDVAATLADLNRHLGEGERQPASVTLATDTSAPLLATASAADGAITPEALFQHLQALVPARAAYALESTSVKQPFWQHMHMTQARSYYFPAAGGLGFALPAAIGVQMADPERRMVAVIGDGSAQYSISALWTAVRHRVPVVFIIVNNSGYRALGNFAALLKTEHVPGLSFDENGMDFAPIARGYRMDAQAVATITELRAALIAAFAINDRPYLIDVKMAD